MVTSDIRKYTKKKDSALASSPQATRRRHRPVLPRPRSTTAVAAPHAVTAASDRVAQPTLSRLFLFVFLAFSSSSSTWLLHGGPRSQLLSSPRRIWSSIGRILRFWWLLSLPTSSARVGEGEKRSGHGGLVCPRRWCEGRQI
jgi:hypothetical protein